MIFINIFHLKIFYVFFFLFSLLFSGSQMNSWSSSNQFHRSIFFSLLFLSPQKLKIRVIQAETPQTQNFNSKLEKSWFFEVRIFFSFCVKWNSCAIDCYLWLSEQTATRRNKNCVDTSEQKRVEKRIKRIDFLWFLFCVIQPIMMMAMQINNDDLAGMPKMMSKVHLSEAVSCACLSVEKTIKKKYLIRKCGDI